jgi:hypothetical protein
MAAVFGVGGFGRRLLESIVGLFAILGFVYVPLGRHTGFEHAKAVLSTPAALRAWTELNQTALGLRERAFSFVSERLGATAPSGAVARPSTGERPRPVPPRLH